MWVKSLELENLRCFEKAELAFSKRINLIVGPNNAGKSTLLRPLLHLQEKLPQLTVQDIRYGADVGIADVELAEHEGFRADGRGIPPYLRLVMQRRGNVELTGRGNPEDGGAKTPQLPPREPNNFIYPLLSRRKATPFRPNVDADTVAAVPSTLENLTAQVDRLVSNPVGPALPRYLQGCKEILGMTIHATGGRAGGGGKELGYALKDEASSDDYVFLDAMGDGVPNILGLLTYLLRVKDRLFIIEEPENDIHPRALKRLLGCLASSSENNQFIITTHSNIVLKHLGAVPGTKVFRVERDPDERVPTSTVCKVGSEEGRRAVLEDLGYELHDVDMWDAWLILEESSAEKIIKRYLIPWFVPSLQGRLGMVSAKGVHRIEPTFEDFRRLFTFLHLQAAYKDRAWVVVDGDEKGRAVIEKLRGTYSNWDPQHFLCLKQDNFESYYPACFAKQINTALGMPRWEAKQEEKSKLRAAVEEWLDSNGSEARDALGESARDVIDILKGIEAALGRPVDVNVASISETEQPEASA
jgi:hypothetical protein